MKRTLERAVARWLEAGVLEADAARRIRDFEAGLGDGLALRWPVLAAWGFGGLMLLAGVLLFVAANWDTWSPTRRFVLVLAAVAALHVLGAAVATSQPVLARVFHAVGTVTCGAGIFLAAQIFNLSEHWPGGFMLWSLAAVAGWALLRDWVQAALAAVLIPIWLVGEWTELTRYMMGAELVAPAAVTLLALTYLTLPRADERRPFPLALAWLGGLAFFPAMISLGGMTTWTPRGLPAGAKAISTPLLLLGWSMAVAAPLILAFLVRRRGSLGNAVAAVWVVTIAQTRFDSAVPYVLCGVASLGMMAWGVREERKERINFGVAGFGLTVLFFYFSNVMDMLNRSVGLMVFGVVFILLGFALTRLRGTLMRRLSDGAAS